MASAWKTYDYYSVKTIPLAMPPDLITELDQAAALADSSRSAIARQAIRLGLPEWKRRFKAKPSLLEQLQKFKGLEIPQRHYPVKLRS